MAGPWKLPKGDVREWFQKLSLEEVSEGLAPGAQSMFLGEKRDIVEVDAKEAGSLA